MCEIVEYASMRFRFVCTIAVTLPMHEREHRHHDQHLLPLDERAHRRRAPARAAA